MFVLVVKVKAAEGKEKELEQLFLQAVKNVRREEKDVPIYNCHRKIGNPSEILMYEVYRDKKAWEVTHAGKSYIKELGANLPKYTAGDIEVEEYELVEPD